jgi:DNA polymerase-3 subunit delta
VKYHQLAAFEKHLQEVFPDHLSSLYMVASASDFERKQVIEKICAKMRSKDSALTQSTFLVSTISLEKVLEQLNTCPLFGGAVVVVLEEVEKLKKEGCAVLMRYLERPSPFAYLILSGSSLKSVNDLYQKHKKVGIVLDLTEEKPWERERRLKEGLVQDARKQGKVMNSDAAAYLLEQIGPDMPCLEQELIKVLCYVGDQQRIELKDVRAVCKPQNHATGWQYAESVVWKGECLPADAVDELSALIPLIGQLRYHFEIGHKIQTFVEQGLPAHEIATQLPQVRSAAFEKYYPVVRNKPPGYFQQALMALFDLELACKNGKADPLLLFDLFIGRLHVAAIA